MKKVIQLTTLFLLFCFTSSLFAQEGEKLTKEFWKSLKANDVETLSQHIADGFQSIHADGSRDKAAELELIKNLHLGDYELTDFVETSVGHTIIVTYKVVVSETIDGEKLKKAPAARMTIFQKTDDTWMLIAHANLRALK